ncbi:MAG: sulfatase [Deltaproteobacteria bacterium]|nr:sulfatase [Deltaproteobacteria bacterium]
MSLPLLLCAGVGALGCAERPAPSPPPAASRSAAAAATQGASAPASASAAPAPVASLRRPPGPQNVIIVFVDAMRADMPWQGYAHAIAPGLTELAAQSVVYPRAYSVSSYTAKCMGAVLSGRYPSTLYRGPTFFTAYSRANAFFPELLQQHGARTMAVQAHGYFDRDKCLSQGFDVWQVVPGLKWNAETDENVTGPKMTEMALSLLGDARNTRGPFLLWLHYMDPHDKYVVHEGVPRFGRRARDFYDGEIYFTDMQIQRLLAFCRQQPWWKSTVLIVTGDHGEAFGEHEQWKHAFALWEVLTRVPLMVHGPGIEPRRIEARRSHIDLAPTVLDLMRLGPDPGHAGHSLAPELYGGAPESREPILLDLPADNYNPPTRALIEGDFKLLEDPGPKYKLYDLVRDPGETRNLAGVAAYGAELARLRARFEQVWSKHPYVAPYGGGKLVGGGRADGPMGPPGWVDPDGEKRMK